MRKLAVAVVLLLAIGAEAQSMPGKWWRRDEVAQKLELTRDQQSRLDRIFLAVADDLIDAKASVQKLELALRGELDRQELRRAEIQRIAAQLSAARARLFERELMMLADMREVLDAEQWHRLRNMDVPRPGPHRPRGRRR